MLIRNVIAVICIVLFFTQCKKSNSSETTKDSVAVQPVDSIIEVPTGPVPPGELKRYHDRLAQLPARASSAIKAMEIFKTEFNKGNPMVNDSALQRYLIYQSDLMTHLNEELANRADYEQISSSIYQAQQLSDTTEAYLKDLSTNGFAIFSTEGSTYIDCIAANVKDYFYAYLSPGGKAYYDQWLKEKDQVFSSDGGIIISIKDLGDRVAFWDQYEHQYAGQLYSTDAKNLKKIYLYNFLAGMDNTPAFGYEDKTVSTEFMDAYRHFIEKNPSLESTAVIKSYVELLTKSDFKYSPKVEAFQKKYNVY